MQVITNEGSQPSSELASLAAAADRRQLKSLVQVTLQRLKEC